ncbi:MAG: hypothetical protein ACXVBW_13530, partial [Bdellovibrionota bacterium]
MRMFLGSLLILGANLALAEDTGPLSRAEEAKLVEVLKSELEPSLRTLSRDIYTFHWAYRSKTGVNGDDPRPPELSKYVRDRTNFLFTEGRFDANIGGGLYAATDPVSTRDPYGGDDPAVIQFRVHAGSRFINYDDGAIVSHETAVMLSRAGCNNYIPEVGARFPINFDKTELRAQCKRVYENVFHQLGVVGFRYSYNASILDGCDSAHAWSGGAFAFGNEVFDHADIDLYWGKEPKTHSKDREFIHSLFNFASNTMNPMSGWGGFSFVTSPFFKSGDHREAQRVAQRNFEEARARVQDHLFMCSPLKYPEDLRLSELQKRVSTIPFAMDNLRIRAVKVSKQLKLPVHPERLREVEREVRELDRYRGGSLFPLTADSLGKLAKVVSPGAVYSTERLGAKTPPSCEPKTIEPTCPDAASTGVRAVEATMSELAKVTARQAGLEELQSILKELNDRLRGPIAINQTSLLIRPIQKLLKLQPFTEANTEIAWALLNLTLDKNGFPPIHRVLWDDELKHAPEVLELKVMEELSRRAFTAEYCVGKYEKASRKAAAELLK